MCDDITFVGAILLLDDTRTAINLSEYYAVRLKITQDGIDYRVVKGLKQSNGTYHHEVISDEKGIHLEFSSLKEAQEWITKQYHTEVCLPD